MFQKTTSLALLGTAADIAVAVGTFGSKEQVLMHPTFPLEKLKNGLMQLPTWHVWWHHTG